MIYAGIDWSLTSPAVCIYDDNKLPFSFSSVQIYNLNDHKKIQSTSNIKITEHFLWKSPQERYHKITKHFLPVLEKADKIMLEDYSMGSKGKVFHIAENTEVLKYNLWLMGKDVQTIAPTSLKKFATGKGNATKEMMHDAFQKLEKTNLFKLLDLKEKIKIDSPISDIVDCYFLCRYAFICYNINR